MTSHVTSAGKTIQPPIPGAPGTGMKARAWLPVAALAMVAVLGLLAAPPAIAAPFNPNAVHLNEGRLHNLNRAMQRDLKPYLPGLEAQCGPAAGDNFPECAEKQPLPPALRRKLAILSLPALFEEQDVANDVCRGGASSEGVTTLACSWRDHLMDALKVKGWCWGPEDAAAYQQHWIPCPGE
ncbi:hypothetical protein E3E12_07020 [Formicincola oecophyllae]|uniref:Uncharacterized protein n=1 Tax=Formicincola oecophyllae TaxID=2558361 RepID=A0A4Y6UBM4_9PROT|nr:hypothetical protein [Formicincola oecophyllae]QDH13968.1 hypothetical protein E3E12_07020 [Formicincola oecophyllae]